MESKRSSKRTNNAIYGIWHRVCTLENFHKHWKSWKPSEALQKTETLFYLAAADFLPFLLISFFCSFQKECNFEPGCHFSRLSCRYLSHLNQSIIREYYNDPQSAVEAVKNGQVWGVVYFSANFSSGLAARMILGLWNDHRWYDSPSSFRV